jgi:uncharacterized protein YecE (DUF72 family)
MRLHVGTSGFSYDAWKGPFYPEDLPASGRLAFYAARFGTVEINNTFYRMPTTKVVEQWASQVPEGFQFVLKAPKRITHEKRLKEVGDSVAYLFATAAVLGAKLGPVLFQLPPFLKKDLAALDHLLSMIPAGRRAALEFRHASWDDDEVRALLRAKDAALCAADTDEEPLTAIAPTASWGYLRLRRVSYEPADLAAWVERVRTQSWTDAFVFFKHEDEGTGPRFAEALLQAWNA